MQSHREQEEEGMHHFNRMGRVLAGLTDADTNAGMTLAAFAASGRKRRREPQVSDRRFRAMLRD